MTVSSLRRRGGAAGGLFALITLLAITLGVPVVLATLGAVPHGVPSVHDILNSLTTKDNTGEYFRIFGGATVWIAWAIYTAATVKEIAATIRHRGRPVRAPRHGLGRLGPAALVTAAAMLFLATPPPPTSTPQASATPPPLSLMSTSASPAAGLAHSPVTEDQSRAEHQSPPQPPAYTVQRYDTVWSIAQHHLPGNPADRYKDIKKLNPDAVGPDNEIQPGAHLTMPDDAYGLPAQPPPAARHGVEDVPVEPGDTLSGITAAHGVNDWHTAWPLNVDHPEPGGERFTDPDHIEPGWTVVVPATPSAATPPASSPHPTATHPAATAPTRNAPPKPAPRPASRPAATGTAAPSAANTPLAASSPPVPNHVSAPSETSRGSQADHGDHDSGAVVREVVYGGGGGVLLAAGILSALLAHRRRQFRHRRPGRMISSPAAELAPTEKALLTYGPTGAPDVAFLDYALRSLGAATAESTDARLPDVVAVRMLGDQLDLRVAEPHPIDPPAPWTVDDTGYWWSVNVGDELPVSDANAAEQYLAPYPTLVAIGHEPAGGTWLIDLEAAGAVELTGDAERCLDLGRFIAAELAVNAWSDQLTVTLVGFGHELVALNPDRLTYASDLDTAAQALSDQVAATAQAADTAGVDVLGGRLRSIAADMWMPQVLLVAPNAAHTEHDQHTLQRLLMTVRGVPGPSTVAVVLAGDHPTTDMAAHIALITSDGTLTVPGLGVTLTAEQMPAAQIADLARLLDQAAQLSDVPMPRSAGNKPIDQFVDAGGGLLPELTTPRIAAGESAAPAPDDTSVLPDADAEYLRDGATSPQELQAIAPRVTAERRAQIIAADPTLDADLADWLDPASARPRLRLLGPVALTAAGVRPPKRIGYHTEVAAYIGTRDHGATAEQMAAAFDVNTTSIYSRINTVRAWLGTDPDSGQKYLPDSTQSAAGRSRGVGVYEFAGVLIDADLFKRLRARAQAGGAEGLRYLQAALDLVAGPPFDQLREGGYGWLADTSMDHVLVAGIVDLAHMAHLRYLGMGDLPRARAAAETALRAAPYEHIPRLDLAAVMKKEGLEEEADRYIRDEVCNDAPRGEAPEDLPDRTQEILRLRAWLTRAS
jgi:hypothetical protein